MRLVTRSDFDGIGCGALLFSIGVIDEWLFVHPKDLQEGNVEIRSSDVLANVPYVEGCGMWFDHHISEESRLDIDSLNFEGVCKRAPSAARIIWDYYGGSERFPERFSEMINAVDKVDSADLTIENILDPQGWIKLGFITDPRSGFGRFHHFRISNLELMGHLIRYMSAFPVDELLQLPDIAERIAIYDEQISLHNNMLEACSKITKGTCVVDLRNQEIIYIGNRFYLYAMYPDIEISVTVLWGKGKESVVITVGRSIINPHSKVNIGEIMLKYGGGGHAAVGTCQVPIDKAETAIEEIVSKLNS